MVVHETVVHTVPRRATHVGCTHTCSTSRVRMCLERRRSAVSLASARADIVSSDASVLYADAQTPSPLGVDDGHRCAPAALRCGGRRPSRCH